MPEPACVQNFAAVAAVFGVWYRVRPRGFIQVASPMAPLPTTPFAPMTPSRNISRLLEIMAALRTPGSGCPWDLEQNFATIAPYTLEEAYEVADAIARDDLEDLREELGDLLLQVVFHARMAQEQATFDFGDVVQSITEKLIRRHPHVFGDAGRLSSEAVEGLWERIKAEEKAGRTGKRRGAGEAEGALAGVPATLPALTRALKLQGKASKVGFDWNDPLAVLKKIREEADEIEADIAAGNRASAALEVGDLLFAVVNLARHLDADPEAMLRASNLKFERRFAAIEGALARRGKSPGQASLAEMDALWDDAKAAEKANSKV
jgi:ATP diphosphatase